MQGFTPTPLIRGVVNWLLVASFTLLGVNTQAALNDTGITTCSNATQNGLPCPMEGFPGQDAEYGTNSFDFTKLDANGNPLPVTATNHSCVKDNVTGLIWEVKTDDGGLRDKDWTYTWFNSNSPDGNPGTAKGGTCATAGRCDTEKFVADINAAGLCGHNDWRMPNPQELAGIVDYSMSSNRPTIDKALFPNTLPTWFWTASRHVASSNLSWIVSFYYGYVFSYYGHRDYAYPVRLVRGANQFFVFTDNGNGTVTEISTNLMWAKCAEGLSGNNCDSGNVVNSMSWTNALNAANNSTLAGYNDWRLPNVKELHTLVDYNKQYPSINATYFPNTPSEWYWTASQDHFPYGLTCSWLVDFKTSQIIADQKQYNKYTARLVRDAQPTALVQFNFIYIIH